MNPSFPNTQLVPVIPEHSPFTKEQIAWLNGYFAGLFSWKPVDGAGPATTSAPPVVEKKTITLAFGSQTGTCESLTKSAAKLLATSNLVFKTKDLGSYTLDDLKKEKYLLIITSTYGEGEPPDNVKVFHEVLSQKESLNLNGLQYAVLSLGDTNYAKFCQCGKDLDGFLARHGAQPLLARVDCDTDYEELYKKWISDLKVILGESKTGDGIRPMTENTVNPVDKTVPEAGTPADSPYSKKNPFPAKLIGNSVLNKEGSQKETRHLSLSLVGSGLKYEPGDALGVFPMNCPELVDEVLRATHLDPEDAVLSPEGSAIALREALLHHYDIGRVSREMVLNVAEKNGKEASAEFLASSDLLDFLRTYEFKNGSAAEFVASLKKIQPRLYSISSSLSAHPEEVHLSVGVVRYERNGRLRKGVASTFFAERCSLTETAVPVFIHTNKSFRLPDSDRPIIMVGPGTGIAPFRAFLEERKVTAAKGNNWLFFGDQKSSCDFLYREELEAFQKENILTRLDLAFSRDQEEKIYVQNRMLEKAYELYAWLCEGASFYVCGDASKMAKDVDAALHQVAQKAGGMTPEKAVEWIRSLQAEKRYVRDVY